MTIIASIDGSARRVYLHSDTVGTSLHPIDIYKEMRSLRLADESLRVWDLFMRADGNVDKGGGKFTERYVTLLGGTRIVPFDATQQLTITGTLITDTGQEGSAAFDRTSLTPTTIVDLIYAPPQVEVITVSTGSGLSVEQDDQLNTIFLLTAKLNTLTEELHRLQGLELGTPATNTTTGRIAGDISLVITGDGETTSTVTRQAP